MRLGILMILPDFDNHLLTEPSPDTASTLLDQSWLFNPAAVVSGEPTVINCPVTGRCHHTA
jgi:hypothetical protein